MVTVIGVDGAFLYRREAADDIEIQSRRQSAATSLFQLARNKMSVGELSSVLGSFKVKIVHYFSALVVNEKKSRNN